MRCRICGSVESEWQPLQRQSLCAPCLKDTPPKVSQSTFDRLYWGLGLEVVPVDIRKKFYDDFLASTLGVEDYVARPGGQVGSRSWLPDEGEVCHR